MKILIADWDSFGDKDIEEVFKSKGYEILKAPYVESEPEEVTSAQLAGFEAAITDFRPDCVFSYNYFPPISDICQKAGVIYISWVYDSPYMHLYSESVKNPVNRVFLFDAGMYGILAGLGIDTVYHLPLAVHCARYNRQCGTPSDPSKPGHINLTTGRISLEADVSFVGSLYTEARHRIFDNIGSAPYVSGYLDAIVRAQKNVYGADLITPLLTDEIIRGMMQDFPYATEDDIFMSARDFYSQYVLMRRVTSQERQDILRLVGLTFNSKKIMLYTNDPDTRFKNVKNIGAVDYYSEMPSVFHSTRINLNITLRSILTGIPLRAIDIMASGGFLLSNYQSELAEGFHIGEECDIYTDYEDLLAKIDYYLSHPSERKDVAAAGWKKVQEEYSLDKRVDEMFETALS